MNIITTSALLIIIGNSNEATFLKRAKRVATFTQDEGCSPVKRAIVKVDNYCDRGLWCYGPDNALIIKKI